MRKKRVETNEHAAEPLALRDVAAVLDSRPDGAATLEAVLQIVLRELDADRGALFVRGEDAALILGASCGLPSETPPTLAATKTRAGHTTLGPGDEAHDRHGLVLVLPIRHRDRLVGALGLGPRRGGLAYGSDEIHLLRSVAARVAAPIENGLLYAELRRAQQRLSLKRFELHNLFDLSRDLTGSFAEEAIQELVLTTLLGNFLVSRSAIYLVGPGGISLARGRGLRRDAAGAPIPLEEARAALECLTEPKAVAELPHGPLRVRLEAARLALAVPLAAGDRVLGVLAIGERASGLPFSQEDRDLAQTLARQSLAAIENVRLQRIRDEKQRQDRELQIAREIQESLLPPRAPELAGFEVAGESRPCYEVGGDAYDWIPLAGDRLALVVADVAGKGTPASLLMASTHAFVHALAGTRAPADVVSRLNRFLFARTQASRFVTLFYAELDPGSRRLVYVNAGHVPPYQLAPSGAVGRLSEGGPALGLLPEAAYAVGEVTLEPGEIVAMVTDGVSEAMSPDDNEFGDDRVVETLRLSSRAGASAVLRDLVAAVNRWAGARGGSDDLTAVILKAC